MNVDKWIEALQNPVALSGAAILLFAAVWRHLRRKRERGGTFPARQQTGNLVFLLILMAMAAWIAFNWASSSSQISDVLGFLAAAAGGTLEPVMYFGI
jgi:hypothetical protein